MAYGQGDDIQQLLDRVVALEGIFKAFVKCQEKFDVVAGRGIAHIERWNEARLHQKRTLIQSVKHYHNILDEHGFPPLIDDTVLCAHYHRGGRCPGYEPNPCDRCHCLMPKEGK